MCFLKVVTFQACPSRSARPPHCPIGPIFFLGSCHFGNFTFMKSENYLTPFQSWLIDWLIDLLGCFLWRGWESRCILWCRRKCWRWNHCSNFRKHNLLVFFDSSIFISKTIKLWTLYHGLLRTNCLRSGCFLGKIGLLTV